MTGESRWSCRFLPTPGRSTIGSMPSAASSSAGPIPDRSRMRGESSAPAASTTSSAVTVRQLAVRFELDTGGATVGQEHAVHPRARS